MTDVVENSLLSIIVPIYNSELYLDECLEAIKNQTYVNIEVLLIDDGSTDSSKEICKKYTESDNRFKYYFKENGGSSSARNYGLDLANGEYVAFVDSDDIVVQGIYGKCIRLANENDYECVRFKFAKDINEIEDELHYKVLSKSDCFVYYNTSQEGLGVYLGIYRKYILDATRFTERVRIGEDYEFLMNVIDKADRIALLDDGGYFYRNNKFGVCNKGYREDSKLYIDNYKKVFETYSEKYSDLYEHFLVYYCIQLLAIPVAMVKSKIYDYEYLKFIRNELKKYKNVFIKSDYVALYFKICCVLFCIKEKMLIIPYKLFIHWWRDA